jgi:hypothetical protein
MLLSEYLAAIRREIERLDSFGFAETIDFREELRVGKQAVVKVEVVLVNGAVLTIREYIDARYGIEKVSYAYNLQGKDGNLYFRFDNAKHKPALDFPEHKHTAEGRVVQAPSPDMRTLLDEVIHCL